MKRKIFVSILLILAAMLALSSCFDSIANKKVDSIQIISGAPTEVEVGKTPDFSALKAKITYNDGTTKEVGYADVEISAIDTSKAGKVEYTISYDGGSTKVTITVKSAAAQGPTITEATLESLSLVGGTIRTEFVVGGDFQTHALKVTAHFSDGTTQTITADKLTIQNIDPDTVGEQTLVITYKGKTLNVAINVIAKVATGFSLNIPQNFNNKVFIGENINTSEITGTLHYNNATTTPVENSEITFSALDSASAGQKTVVATYNGMTAEFTVNVLGVKSITFKGFDKSVKPGQSLNLANLSATFTATDDTVHNISAEDITVDLSEFNSTLASGSQGKTYVSFSYLGATVRQEIKIIATREDAALLSLTVSGVKTSLYVGEAFSDANLTAEAERSYGFSGLVDRDALDISGTVNTAVAGTYPVTYSLTEGDVTKTYTVNVVVVGPSELTLNVNTLGWVVKGEILDTSTITASLYYDENRTDTIANADLTITGVDTSVAGEKVLTVSYAGFEKTVAYEVVTASEIVSVDGISTNVPLGVNAYTASTVKATILLSNGERIQRTVAQGVEIDDTDYDATVAADTSITVKFGGVEKIITITVNGSLDELTLQSIEITAGKVDSIFVGDDYDFDAIIVKATFDRGVVMYYTKEDDMLSLVEFTTDTAGKKTVTASVTHEGVTKTASFEVEVVAVVATELVLGGSYDGSVLLGDAFDKSGITAKLYYNKPGKETTLANADLTITDIDTTTAGVKTVTVSYGDLSKEITVTVVGIKSVKFDGIDARYRVNALSFNTAAIKITVTYTNDEVRVRSYDSALVTLPTLALDNTKAEETKEYTFTYRGVEYKQNIEVYAELEDATLLSIEYTGATTVFVGDPLAGKASIKAYYTYGYVEDYSTGFDIVGFDSSTKGNKTITVTYLDKSATATIAVVYPKVTDVKINSAPIGIKGEAYNYDAINLTITLETNKQITADISALEDYEISAIIDVMSAGDKILNVSANGKSYTYTVKICEIEKIVIDTAGFSTVVKPGTVFSTDSLGKILVYLKGEQAHVERFTTTFNHNVNTAEKGEYALTATYLGVTSDAVKIYVADQNFIITGAEDKSSLAAWKNSTYQKDFLDAGYGYVVGHVNPFKYEIRFQMLDIINNIPELRGIAYESVSSVTLNGNTVGEDYVVIDEINHTFHFTKEAIGKTFVITTAHKDYAKFSKSLTVTVVDGYNVDEAKELNLFTNSNATIGNRDDAIYNENGERIRYKGYLDYLLPFLKNNHVEGITPNMTIEEYQAFVNSINGIVLHDNFTLSTSDFPEEYFFIASDDTNPDGTKYLWDHESLYYRVFTEEKFTKGATPEVFNLYGNYFSVLTYNIPIVAEKGAINNKGIATNEDDMISSSQLFRISVCDAVFNKAINLNKFYHENYIANIYAIGTRDDNPSLSVQPETAKIRSRLGIYSYKLGYATYNMYAANAQAFFNTLTAEYDDLTVNLDYCSFYNAWNNHISTWTNNLIDQHDPEGNEQIHDGYQPTRININNSFLGKSGGPVILAISSRPTDGYNLKAGSKPIITIDEKTNIFSYVKGDESWFQTYQADGVAAQISGYDKFFSKKDKDNGINLNSTFLTEISGSNNKFMNMICLFMDSSFNPASLDGVTSDINGSITIGGKVIQDMNTTETGQYGHGGAVDIYKGSVGAAPLFVSSEGGICFTDTTTGLYELTGTGPVPIFSADHAAVSGDHLAMFLYNLGLTLGMNEPTIAREPAPADCTVVRITATHGYN